MFRASLATKWRRSESRAHLLELGGDWPERIYRAEQHRYFKGQIGFLLRFCGVNLKDPDEELARLDAAAADELVAPYERYFAYAALMFDAIEDDPGGVGPALGACAIGSRGLSA